MSLLSIRNLSVFREKNGARFTLFVPRLDLYSGRTLAVVGRSGCGKSTLLDVLALILRPHGAERFVLYPQNSSLDLFTANAKQLARIRGRELGYVLQSGGLLPFLSVKENILLPARLLGLHGKGLHFAFERITDALEIRDQLEKKPQHLSGGQRQRVAIARALVHRPRIVLADEPTAAVDQETAENICALFQALAANWNVALVMVSHDQELMRRHADSLVSFEISRQAENTIRSTLVFPEGDVA